MKDHTPSGGSLRFAGLVQRLLSLLVLGVFACLVWLASTGQFDNEVHHLARWLQARFDELTR